VHVAAGARYVVSGLGFRPAEVVAVDGGDVVVRLDGRRRLRTVRRSDVLKPWDDAMRGFVLSHNSAHGR
jgi:hypothetical protein